MTPKKYSTGTKGRLKMHNDRCREFIHANSPNFALATEFIASMDPDHEDATWQRYQNPEEILPELTAWLGGGEVPATPPTPPPPIAPKPATPATALEKTRAWLASPEVRAALSAGTPMEAAEAAIEHFRKELAGA